MSSQNIFGKTCSCILTRFKETAKRNNPQGVDRLIILALLGIAADTNTIPQIKCLLSMLNFGYFTFNLQCIFNVIQIVFHTVVAGDYLPGWTYIH